MISKRFDELGILVYYKYRWKYEVKNDFYNLSLLFTHILKKSLEEQVVEIRNVSESSLKFTFGLGDCRDWDFARPILKHYCSKFT